MSGFHSAGIVRARGASSWHSHLGHLLLIKCSRDLNGKESEVTVKQPLRCVFMVVLILTSVTVELARVLWGCPMSWFEFWLG